jgi:hypothetical protein
VHRPAIAWEKPAIFPSAFDHPRLSIDIPVVHIRAAISSHQETFGITLTAPLIIPAFRFFHNQEASRIRSTILNLVHNRTALQAAVL